MICGMFLSLRPAASELSAFVSAYVFIEDLPGEHAGRPIRTTANPFAVLSVNMGRANAADDGSFVPRASLLGLQSRARSWRSWSETYFVMVMLTVPGLVRFFANTGAGSADRMLDLGAVMGDGIAGSLANDVDAAWEPRKIRAQLDRWLMGRLDGTTPVSEGRQMLVAHDVLRRGGSVEMAARAADVGRRQLHRWFNRHLGLGPKDVADLERLHASLISLQTGDGDSVAGFSDQAHQIRSWRRRLNETPGAYRSRKLSPMAAHFSSQNGIAGPAFYL